MYTYRAYGNVCDHPSQPRRNPDHADAFDAFELSL